MPSAAKETSFRQDMLYTLPLLATYFGGLKNSSRIQERWFQSRRPQRQSSSHPNDNNKSSDFVQKIQKIFTRAQHQNANESEVRIAVKRASHLMTKFNITEADLKQRESSDEQKKRGDISIVSITPPREWKRGAIHQAWTSDLSVAMHIFFDCKSYWSQKDAKIE